MEHTFIAVTPLAPTTTANVVETSGEHARGVSGDDKHTMAALMSSSGGAKHAEAMGLPPGFSVPKIVVHDADEVPAASGSAPSSNSRQEGTLRWFLLQLVLLVVFILLMLKHFQFVSLFAKDCVSLQLHNVPYCTVVDFVLSIIVILVVVGIFLHKKTWVISTACELGRKYVIMRGWLL